MGKGDRKTRRGKLFSGSYGVLRARKKRQDISVVSSTKKAVAKKVIPPVLEQKSEPKEAKPKVVKKEAVEAKPEVKVKPEVKEKPAAAKTVKKPAPKKEAKPKKEEPKKEEPKKEEPKKEEPKKEEPKKEE